MVNAVRVPSQGLRGVLRWMLLTVLVAVVHSPVFTIRPLGGDNFRTLAWVDAAPASALLTLDPARYPQWRPLVHASIWLEHRVVPLQSAWIHFAVNAAWWAGCLWLVHRLVALQTGSWAIAWLAALMFFVDHRAIETLLVIQDRQTTMAIGFGLMALLIVLRARSRRLTPAEMMLVVVTAIASGLSKEYGLSYGMAIAVYGLWCRRRDLALPALTALVAYALLRLRLVDGAVGLYCEDMGFFFGISDRCMDPADGITLAQGAYNVAASLLGIPLRGVFSEEGLIEIQPARLAVSVPLAALAALGLWKGPRGTGVIALVIPFNAVLSFLVYRDRSLLIGAASIAALAGSGYAHWAAAASAGLARRIRVSATVTFVMALTWLTTILAADTAGQVADIASDDPCAAHEVVFPYGRRFAPIVKAAYGLDNPTCEP